MAVAIKYFFLFMCLTEIQIGLMTPQSTKEKMILHSGTVLTGLAFTFIFPCSGSEDVSHFALVQLDQLHM